MGRIVVSENITLDGVMQDPVGSEGFAFGGWFDRMSDTDRKEWAEVGIGEAHAVDAMLLGRRSYEWFAPRWATREGAWADRLRSLPKYVVSSTLRDLPWANTTVVTMDDVAALKQSVAGDIVVNASGQLAQTLMANGLVDELKLILFPFVLGAGDRLFRTTDLALRLVETRAVGENLVVLTYRPA